MILDRSRWARLQSTAPGHNNRELAFRETLGPTPSIDKAITRHNRRKNITRAALTAIVFGSATVVGNAYCERQTGQSFPSLIKGEVTQRLDSLKAEVPRLISEALPPLVYKH